MVCFNDPKAYFLGGYLFFRLIKSPLFPSFCVAHLSNKKYIYLTFYNLPLYKLKIDINLFHASAILFLIKFKQLIFATLSSNLGK